jgi:hypothetical protein
MGGQRHVPPALPTGETRYPLYRRLGGPQGRSGRMRKISPPPGFDTRTVHSVASRYTDSAIPAHKKPVSAEEETGRNPESVWTFRRTEISHDPAGNQISACPARTIVTIPIDILITNYIRTLHYMSVENHSHFKCSRVPHAC